MFTDSKREAALFQAAALLSGAERAAFLEAACRNEPALRQRLEQRFCPPDPVQGDLTEIVPDAETTLKVDFRDDLPVKTIGSTIGRYKILEMIGEGGCGVVYVSEQTEPVRRRVALKVIKLGMDTKAVVARFEAERQALAMMDHPNIAKVLDAGATETGRPYFVMELVRGIRITDYCDQNNLTTTERLELFIPVCQAIQHAHQKGIIHRDIKPSNILVTLHDGVPVPKVIDFGIAKATEGRLTDATVYTQLHQFIGTPAYMSPEQAEMSGLDVDTRSDIYSLGVLLYELLTGRTPFDPRELMELGLDAMRKTIREKEPLRPSTRLATLKGEELTTTAKRRSAEVPKLIHLLRGDLDWIVMKCLEKDRTRRYDTANGVAMDVKRHLNNEPVAARPASSAYQLQKLVRRNKLAFAGAGAVTLALLMGFIASAWQAVRATRAKEDALAANKREALEREKAQVNEKQALEAKASEARLRRLAQSEGLAARRRAYASDMNVAKAALDGNNFGRALELLKRQRPEPGQKDLRGWEWRYLWEQSRSDALFTFGNISGVLHCLAASPDGHWLVAGSELKGGLHVWDLPTRKETAHLAQNERYLRAAFSSAEPLLAFTGVEPPSGAGSAHATGSVTEERDRSTLHIWNLQTRQMVVEFPLDTVCTGVAFTQDGRTLVTSTGAGRITVWRMPGATKLASYPSEQASTEGGTQFCISPDGTRAAYASRDGRIHLIDLRDGKELWTAAGSKEYILSLAFSPDGKRLASGGGYTDSQLRLWDTASGSEIGHLDGHSSWIGSLVFWPDGKKLASASADETIRLWDLDTGKCLDVLRGHDKEVWRLDLLPDNRTLVSGGKDGTICFWDTSTVHARVSRIILAKTILAFRFAPDSRSLLTLDTQGQITRWSGAAFEQNEPVLTISPKLQDIGPLIAEFVEVEGRRFLFSPDARFLAVSAEPNLIQVWDIARRILRSQLTNTAGALWPRAFLSSDSLIAWSRKDNFLQQWDLSTQRVTSSWKTPAQFLGTAVSPDEQSCIAFGYEGDAILTRLAEGGRASTCSLTPEMTDAAFSPDGTFLAVASELGSGQVWNTASWTPEATLGGFLLSTHSVGFSSDGSRLAVSSDDKEALKLWETEGWQEVLTLPGEGSLFHRAAFSPDGNTIGVLNGHGLLHLWHAPSWQEIAAAEAKEKAEGGQQ